MREWYRRMGEYRLMFLDQNLKRFVFTALIAIPVNIVHILVFMKGLDDPDPVIQIWRKGIIVSHIGLMLVFALGGTFFHLQRKKGIPNPYLSQSVFHFCFLLIILLAVTIVSFDQMVTPSITPFLVVSIMLAALFFTDPLVSSLFFLISYGIFYAGIGFTQENQVILLSNRVNGITAIALAMIISHLMWGYAVERKKQHLKIIEQKQEMENNLEELRTAAENLSEANKAKDALFNIIAHDLNQPFNVLLGFSELLSESIRNGDYRAASAQAEQINRTAEQTYELVNELLLWARSQSGSFPFHPEYLKLDDILKEIEQGMEVYSNAKNLEIIFPADTDLKFYSDLNMFKTIMRNLLSNAVKFSHPGGKIEVSASGHRDHVMISISDQGVGMEDEAIRQLFNENLSVSRRGTSNEKGTGLGLLLSKAFVEKNKGKIMVRSKVGEGSIFSFTVPLSEDSV